MGLQLGLHPGRSRLCGGPGQHLEISRQGRALRRRRFLLCYLLIVFLVGFPVMLAELSIGRATQKNVVGAFRTLNPRWRFAGYIGIVTLFVILSYYCVVGAGCSSMSRSTPPALPTP